MKNRPAVNSEIQSTKRFFFFKSQFCDFQELLYARTQTLKNEQNTKNMQNTLKNSELVQYKNCEQGSVSRPLEITKRSLK